MRVVNVEKAVWPRPGQRTRAQQVAHSSSRRLNLPHRSLPREGSDHEHPLLSVCHSFLEPIWNRNYVASVQITLSRPSAWGSAAPFTRQPAACANVIQNHLFQVVALLCHGHLRASTLAQFIARSQGISGHAALTPDDVVRGQYAGYRDEQDVAKHSDC